MKSFKSINEEGNWQRLNKYGATYTITCLLYTSDAADE